MVFRLAHISDIHLGPLPKVRRRDLFSKRFTGYINFRRNRTRPEQAGITAELVKYVQTLHADHTAITGDLINIGLDAEIENARLWLEKLGAPDKNTVVLGNHDAYVRGARAKAFAAWQPWIGGDDGRMIDHDRDYPVLRRRGSVSIIACNSARASAPFLATGYFKKAQAEGLERILDAEMSAGQICVILIHHPPYPRATPRYKRLKGVSLFTSVIRNCGAHLILHGHTHLATTAYLHGQRWQVPVVGVPAAYQWHGHEKPAAGCNLFSIVSNDHQTTIGLERHGLAPGELSFGVIREEELLRISRPARKAISATADKKRNEIA